jgi:hypothetical protein
MAYTGFFRFRGREKPRSAKNIFSKSANLTSKIKFSPNLTSQNQHFSEKSADLAPLAKPQKPQVFNEIYQNFPIFFRNFSISEKGTIRHCFYLYITINIFTLIVQKFVLNQFLLFLIQGEPKKRTFEFLGEAKVRFFGLPCI